jgi:S1-C subfamily serine protease
MKFRIGLPYKLVAGIAIFSTCLAGTALWMAWPTYTFYSKSDPKIDGFVPPRSMEALVRKAQLSTVTIYCRDKKDGPRSLGSGWATDLDIDIDNQYPTAIVTNFHVIEDCIRNDGSLIENSLSVETLEGVKEWSAIVYDFDEENDLAIIQTAAPVKKLKMSPYKPLAGYWVVAIGTADGYQGSVAFGNVLNIDETEVLITANISHGNSGGPLLDNLGMVIGTNTWGRVGEQYNGAKSLDAMCAVFIECGGDKYWDD